MRHNAFVLIAALLPLAAANAMAAESSGALSTIKHDAKTVGHDVATGAKHVGHAVKEGASSVGRSVSHGARTAGHAVASGAVAAGHAIKKGAKAVGDGAVEGVGALKQKLDPTQSQPVAPIEQGSH